MAFFDDLSKKVKDVASVATEKTKDGVELAKINMAIAGEQREIEKNYKAIGEWFVSEYTGEIPEGVKELVEAVAASKAKIADLEASKPRKEEEPAPAAEPQPAMKACPICGAESDSKFCPQCGAPMDT
ncbi:zinc ribbon domain-containing protein [Dysosmobacter sp. HCP28S3_G4]|uniref:zinc ribbon domain-containing protein n=1 Tax=Dysosmobacter sp. HCP28S3_G4 TaxID=3438938 RepID=UPI003F0942D2|nr:zinc ribbon domain-containing protein [Dysosmobacter sp.]